MIYGSSRFWIFHLSFAIGSILAGVFFTYGLKFESRVEAGWVGSREDLILSVLWYYIRLSLEVVKQASVFLCCADIDCS